MVKNKIIEYIGDKVSKKEGDLRADKQIKNASKNKKNGMVYVFELNSRFDIDGNYKYNNACYINHSCDPNCEVEIINNKIWIVSIKNIKKGDKVILWFVSGNRDHEVFKNPHDVILSRSPNPHVSFGQGGVHFCLGIWLARMEVRILLEELAKKIDKIDLLDNPTWTRSNFICGVKSLKVRIA